MGTVPRYVWTGEGMTVNVNCAFQGNMPVYVLASDYDHDVGVLEDQWRKTNHQEKMLRTAIHLADQYARKGDIESVKVCLDDAITVDNVAIQQAFTTVKEA